jgi:hypothetical protein
LKDDKYFASDYHTTLGHGSSQMKVVLSVPLQQFTQISLILQMEGDQYTQVYLILQMEGDKYTLI